MIRSIGFAAWVLLATLLTTACSSSDEDSSQPGDGEGDETVPDGADSARSALARDEDPKVSAADLQELVAGNTAFALALYRELRESDRNLLLAPYSISTGLAMTYAGAGSQTETQMAAALHFDLPQARLHAAMNRLDLAIGSRSVRLDTVNQVFGQQGYEFLDGYLDLLAVNYGAGMMLVDFAGETEAVRSKINGWISDRTQSKLPELIPSGALDTNTVLVLANAIYFQADWLNTFDESKTEQGSFVKADGTSIEVPMMHQQAEIGYAEGEGWKAVELPYSGGELTMLAIVPTAGASTFDLDVDADGLSSIVGSLSPREVALALPRFTFSCATDLEEPLAGLGMVDAFDAAADFSGMDGSRMLYIQAVLHQATVEVNEQGTEASGATAVVTGVKSIPPAPTSVAFDRPFLVLIRDVATNTVLFLGRVANPAA